MKVSLSIIDWHAMCREGTAPQVRILLNGNSMFPLVRWNRDYVTIIPLDRKPVIGDIVLLNRPGTERYVVHRVWKIRNGRVQTWGDHCSEPDSWIPESSVWGRVNLIERGLLRIKPDPKKGKIWAGFWHKAGIVYRFLGRCWHGSKRRIKAFIK